MATTFETERLSRAEWGSDVIVEALRRLDIEYVALNPGATFRGIHDSLVNYLGNTKPEPVSTLCPVRKFLVSNCFTTFSNLWFRSLGIERSSRFLPTAGSASTMSHIGFSFVTMSSFTTANNSTRNRYASPCWRHRRLTDTAHG